MYYSLDEQKTWTDVVQLATDPLGQKRLFCKKCRQLSILFENREWKQCRFYSEIYSSDTACGSVRPRYYSENK